MHGWRIDHALHNYIYFVYYDKYVKAFLGVGRLMVKYLGKFRFSSIAFQKIFEGYHAKVITINDARKILSLNQYILLGPDYSKKIIPYDIANKIIFSEPQFIAVMDCPGRLSRKNYCQPVNVCMAVGRTTAGFWLDHCKKYHVRKIDQKQALEILYKSVQNGRIITAWFKTETGGRTGVICSCCSCCCGGLEGMRLARKLPGGTGITNIIPSGYSIEIDYSICSACGECTRICIFDAQVVGEDSKPIYRREACLGCGTCVVKCKTGARKLVRDEDKGLPLDIDLAKDLLGQPDRYVYIV